MSPGRTWERSPGLPEGASVCSSLYGYRGGRGVGEVGAQGTWHEACCASPWLFLSEGTWAGPASLPNVKRPWLPISVEKPPAPSRKIGSTLEPWFPSMQLANCHALLGLLGGLVRPVGKAPSSAMVGSQQV